MPPAAWALRGLLLVRLVATAPGAAVVSDLNTVPPVAGTVPPVAVISTTATTSSTTRTQTTTSTTSKTSTTTSTTSRTTVTSTTTTTTTPAHVYGAQATNDAYESWLKEWRKLYRYGSPCGVVACLVPELSDDHLPAALRRIRPKVVISDGGVAGGVVTEGMGYGIMVEGFEAARGSHEALDHGLALVRSWLGMVRGPFWGNPLAGGFPGIPKSATEVNTAPYGVSAIGPRNAGTGSFAGLPAWKWPLDQCDGNCNGTATDGDQDAILGMIYLAAALNYPIDFVDMVMRTVIAFASADLGFPDLYRILPGGEKIFVPKMGSTWGGLTPDGGRFKTQQEPWCYSPGYFAPAHYRIFRDFAKHHWQPSFYTYLPKRMDGTATALGDLLDTFDSATIAGYNILYRASCHSGSVANWVGVEAECAGNPAALQCQGVPWRHTPYVGADKGTCSTSHTKFGKYGADASRAPWRIAMDYVLYRDESNSVTMYDRDGKADTSLAFGSQTYLNRFVSQYKWHSQCDGGKPGECLTPESQPPYSPWKLSMAFDPKNSPPDLICDNVPEKPDTWWASYMAYPTFTAFIAPFNDITPEESTCWMDTFVSICNFHEGGKPTGSICGTTYFDLSQEVVATMVMADKLVKLAAVPPLDNSGGPIAMHMLRDASEPNSRPVRAANWRLPLWSVVGVAGALLAVAGVTRALPRRSFSYERLAQPDTLQARPARVGSPWARRLVEQLLGVPAADTHREFKP